jgi:putative tricarboxylic transport membrane protein
VLFYCGILMVRTSGAIMISAITDGGPTFKSLWAGHELDQAAAGHCCAGRLCVRVRAARLSCFPPCCCCWLLRAIDPVRWTLAVPLAFAGASGVLVGCLKLVLIQLPSGMFGIG